MSWRVEKGERWEDLKGAKAKARFKKLVVPGDQMILNVTMTRAMRGIALGRKNYLFAGSDTGGDRAASLYTIVQTAKLNGMNPEAYLRDTLANIADGHPINRIDELMPWRRAADE